MQHSSSDNIDRILSSLDKVERVPAPPYFYTRLRARAEQARPVAQGWLRLQPIALVGMLLVLLLINGWLINTPVANLAVAPAASITEPEDELQSLAFDDRATDHLIAEADISLDTAQK